MSARWSSSRDQSSPVRGSKRKSPVMSSNIMHAALHTSAVWSHSAPMITSGDLYCRVWISLVTFRFTWQPFPKSASLAKTLDVSRVRNRSHCLTGGTGLPQASAAAWSAAAMSAAVEALAPLSLASAAAAAAGSPPSESPSFASALAFFAFSFFFIFFFWLFDSSTRPDRCSMKARWARRASHSISLRSCLCTRTFSSFTSVWMTPREWMYSRPRSVCRASRWTMASGRPL
mmetsp:Transcript_112090/g.317460  ORF Transcript_112090/g.317460 Transcript_112090/m.317460 type:complete len:231 (+) Transcript_112090:677-1369(+)